MVEKGIRGGHFIDRSQKANKKYMKDYYRKNSILWCK